MKEKVYCSDCDFCYSSYANERMECHNENNKKYYDTYYARQFKLLLPPEKLNKNNDCPLFSNVLHELTDKLKNVTNLF